MADEAISPTKTDDLDIENMKVADLKKKLKDIGLPVTGNKSELMERLQGSILAAKNEATAANKEDLEPSSSELDSSFLELNDSGKLTSSIELEDKNGTKDCDDEFSVSSPQKSKESAVTTSAFIPLKKRVVAQASAPSSEKPKEKKIVLNRNHIPTPKFIPNKPIEPLENKNVLSNEKSDIISKDKESKEVITPPNCIKEGLNKISLNAAKNISEDERINLRAKRFNITAPEPARSNKVTVTSTKVAPSNPTSSSSSILTPLATTPTLDVLQKRALRFGENVSKVLKQLEEQQKVLKRKSKFNIGNGTSGEEQEKKKKRAERFGLS